MKKHKKSEKKKAAKKIAKALRALARVARSSRVEAMKIRRPKTKTAKKIVAGRRVLTVLPPIQRRGLLHRCDKMYSRLENVFSTAFAPATDEAESVAAPTPAPAPAQPATANVPAPATNAANDVPAAAAPAENAPKTENAEADGGDDAAESEGESDGDDESGSESPSDTGDDSAATEAGEAPDDSAETEAVEAPTADVPAETAADVPAESAKTVGSRDVLRQIAENPGVNTPGLVKFFDKTEKIISRFITELRYRDFIEFRGALNSGGYFPKPAGLEFLENGNESDEFSPMRMTVDLVFNFICENPGVNHYGIAAHFQRTIKSVSRHTQKLRRLGKIEFRGAARGGGFFATTAEPEK